MGQQMALLDQMKPEPLELVIPDWNDIRSIDKLFGSPLETYANNAINDYTDGEMNLEDLFNYKDEVIDKIINI